MKSKAIVVAVAVVLCAVLGNLSARAAGDEKAAVKNAASAAQKWLALLDKGKYKESWETAAPIVRERVTKPQFIQGVESARKPLGKVISRNLKSTQYTTTMPGAPAGEYVVIQYDTKFEKKDSATEIVTPMLAKDGKWRPGGYVVRSDSGSAK